MRIPLLTNLHFRFSFIYPDLLEPIDVYCSWIDATEAMQRTAQESAQSSSGGGVAAYSDQHADEDNEDLDVEVGVLTSVLCARADCFRQDLDMWTSYLRQDFHHFRLQDIL